MARRSSFVFAPVFALAAMAVVSLDLSAAPAGGGQRFGRFDRDFGLSKEEWCSDRGYGDRRRSACDVREQTLSGVSVVDADTGGNGGIRVRGSDRRDVRVRARIVAWARSTQDAEDLLAESRLSIQDGRIRLENPVSRYRDESVTVSLELEVPREIELRLNTRNGGIGIENYSGRGDARTTNGGLSLDNVGGDLHVETVNGGISIALDGSRWEGTGLDALTRNGGVSMSLPSNYSAELEATTVNGGLDVDFPIVVQGRLTRINRHINATIGSGGPRLRIATTNGGVRISRR